MNRITRERLKKQREAKGFTGIQIKDLGKFFKRKEIQPPTPSGVKPETTKTKPETTKTQTELKIEWLVERKINQQAQFLN